MGLTWTKFLCAVGCCLLTTSALAFKIDTHVLIAQLVFNDARDGKVTFSTLDGQTIQVALPPKVKKALAAPGSAAYFRMGSIGPDAFPGIYEGQMVVHPGSIDATGRVDSSKWGTSEWAMELLRHASESGDAASIAFAHGLLTHLAGDIFAHTYVNAYAGNAWSLADGESVVEQRHFLLEGFISKLNPPIRINGRNYSVPELMGARDSIAGIPSELVTRYWVLDRTLGERYGRAGAPHIAEVSSLYWRLEDLAADNGPVRKFEKKVKRYFFDKYIGIPISDDDFNKLNELDIKFQTEFKKAKNLAVKAVHEWGLMAFDFAGKSSDFQTAKTMKTLDALKKAAREIPSTVNAQRKAERELLSASRKAERLRRRIIDSVPCPPLDLGCDTKKDQALRASKTLAKLEGSVVRALKNVKEPRAEMQRVAEALGTAVNELNKVV